MGQRLSCCFPKNTDAGERDKATDVVKHEQLAEHPPSSPLHGATIKLQVDDYEEDEHEADDYLEDEEDEDDIAEQSEESNGRLVPKLSFGSDRSVGGDNHWVMTQGCTVS